MSSKEGWWEQYYVRYFVGTAVAIPLLILLAQKSDWKIALSEFSAPAWLDAAGVATGGLAFCYLASTPILTLHMARSAFWKKAPLFQVVAVLLAILAITSAIYVLQPSPPVVEEEQQFLLLVPFLVVTALQVLGLLTFAFPRGLKASKKFYVSLAKSRASAAPDTIQAEYVESYRHLREHGNAVSIVTMELILALALYATAGSVRSTCLVLFTWLLPSVFAWFVGTWLEGHVDAVAKLQSQLNKQSD